MALKNIQNIELGPGEALLLLLFSFFLKKTFFFQKDIHVALPLSLNIQCLASVFFLAVSFNLLDECYGIKAIL